MGIPAIVQRTYLQAGTGIRVNRVAVADVAGWVTKFTITGGLVLVTGLVGMVTVLRAGALATTQFRHSIIPTVLNVATATVALPLGAIFTITGNPLDNLVIGAVLGTPIQGGMMGSANPGAPIQQFGMIMPVGLIQVNVTVVTAGSTRYICTYIPLDDGAAIN